MLIKKWSNTAETYNSLFTNENFLPGDDAVNSNANSDASSDLNPLLDQKTYNVVHYQHFINNAALEAGVGTGSWFFDNTTPVTATEGVNPSNKTLGLMTPMGLDLDAIAYDYTLGTVSREAAKAMEPCPNLYQVAEGGSLMIRRDSTNTSCNGLSAYIFAGTGAVTADGGVMVIPQVFDDVEDNVTLELPLTGGAGRRGWYVGMEQVSGMTNAWLTGTYHVVGEVTGLDGADESLTFRSLHGALTFDAAGNVTGALHSKSTVMDQILLDAVAPAVAESKSTRLDVTGTYTAATDGTFSFTMANITEAVTGIAGQVLVLPDSSQVPMLLAIPVVTNGADNGSRGLLLLAHEFLVAYPDFN